jgi:hypothetical protein
MNWGHKILFVYLAFVVGIMLLVFKSSTQKIDLVTPDYYAKELKYQDRIDAEKRTNALSTRVSYQVVNQQMIITFPKEFSSKSINGTVLLYCPSDDKKDVEQTFATSNGSFTMPIPVNNKGSHEVQINWLADGNSYYYKNKLIL